MPTTTARDRLGRRARFASVVVVLLSTALFVTSLATAKQNRIFTGGGLGADHLAFYDAGAILRRFGAARLYDLPLQSAEYHARLPGEPADAFLPYAYAPHVAAGFAALAVVPYDVSYVLWTVISCAAYGAAVIVAARAAQLPKAWWPTIAWLAASFEPFAFECIHGGQISTVATALLALAALLASAGRPFIAGLLVSCCCYKPTLLVIVVPGLLITRRWSTVLGCLAGTIAWAAVDVLAFGFGTCRMYLAVLSGYAGRGALDFRIWKFVDVHSFILLLGGSAAAATAAVAVLVGTALATLRRARSPDDERMFWAATLAWTPVANLYAGAYDAVLVVPAAILTAGVLHRRIGRLPSAFIGLLAAAWLTPWVTSATARWSGIQVMTAALVALAAYLSKGYSVQLGSTSDCKSSELSIPPHPFGKCPLPEYLRVLLPSRTVAGDGFPLRSSDTGQPGTS